MRCSMSWPVLLLCASLATAAHGATPSFVVTPDTLRADAAGTWSTEIVVRNTEGKWGLYPDSLSVSYTSTDPERGSHPRAGSMSLDAFVKLMPPVGAGENGGVSWSSPAEFEHGTLVFRLRAHDAQQTAYVLETTVPVAGGELGDSHPPAMLEFAGQRTDMVVIGADSSRLPAPTILFVPPAGVSARSMMRWAKALTARGYTFAVVSLPGAGRASGDADAAGPASVAAVGAALARLAKDPAVAPNRIVVWGQLEGANAALLAAATHPELQGVIAQDADFDPWASYRALPEGARAAYAAAAGSDSAAWKARSPLAAAERIASPVLVLQTVEARMKNSAPAEAFAARRTARNLYVESRLSPAESSPLRRQDALRITLAFTERRTK